MRKGILLIGALAVIGLAAGSAWAAPTATPKPTKTPTQPTPTWAIPFPVKGAGTFQSEFAHAMDICDPTLARTPGSGVVSLHASVTGHAVLGCAPTYLDDLSGVRFGKAKVNISKSHGKFVLTGEGFVPLSKVALHLVVRSTRKGVGGLLEGVSDMTYTPIEMQCVTTPADLKGKLNQVGYLEECASNKDWVSPVAGPVPHGGSELKTPDVMIEILDATLLDITNGTCVGGSNNHGTCSQLADCPDSDPGTCENLQCLKGTPGPCTTDAICGTGGWCAGDCAGGLRDELPCLLDRDCPPTSAGTCTWKVFARAGIVR